MRRIGIVIGCMFTWIGLFAQTPDLMPLPAKYSLNTTSCRITNHFSISIQGNADSRIYSEASRFFQRLSERTGIFFPTWRVTPTSKYSSGGLQIQVLRTGHLVLGEDESYQLQVVDSGILIKANTDIGAIRALETLLQLLGSDTKGYFFRGANIEDAPRFPWKIGRAHV